MKKRTYSNCSKGFTLIELLVVVAIITLLVVVNFLAVSHYRNQAKDSRIQATLGQIRSVAAIVSSDKGSYSVLCDIGDNTMNQNSADYPALKIIEDETKKLNQNQDVRCFSGENAFCVSTPLNTGGDFCVDYLGYAGAETALCDGTKLCH